MESNAEPVRPATEAEAPPLSLAALFIIWLRIGAQSFGGGTATEALIRRIAVEERGWIAAGDYARESALVPLVPGMNLLAITALLGRRVAGLPGVWVALLGLLLPSVTITLIITALFSHIRNNPLIQKALAQGVVPATVGIGLYNTSQNARALLRESNRLGRGTLIFSIILLVVSFGLALWGKLPIFALLLGGGAIAAVQGALRLRQPAKPEPKPEEKPEP